MLFIFRCDVRESEPRRNLYGDRLADQLHEAAKRELLEYGPGGDSVLTPADLLSRTLLNNPVLKLALYCNMVREGGMALARWFLRKRWTRS